MVTKNAGPSRARQRVRGRGRPQKYGRPSQVVAVTLPREVIGVLRQLHSDLGWAIVRLAERARPGAARATPSREAHLVEVGGEQSLIVLPPDLVGSLPGVRMVPLSDAQAFLALEPGHGMADLEIAVLERLEQLGRAKPESRAVKRLREQLRTWRKDAQLAFETRSIILVTKRHARTARKDA